MTVPKSLNSEQTKAIRHDKGPLLIVAGAGTGKTTVITERIRYLIQEKKVPPENILALTFTEKAAGEMLGRVDEAMPLGYEEPWLSTFHSFCDRILRLEALEIGLDPSFKILPSPEQWLLVRKHLFEFNLKHYRPLGNPTKFISAILKLFSRAKDEIVDADEFLEYAKSNHVIPSTARDPDRTSKTQRDSSPEFTPNEMNGAQNDNIDEHAEAEEKEKLLELANAYKKYQELLIQENAMDFGDLLLWTIKLFKTRPSILKKYQNQFRHILVDEFQDTNYAQYEIIKLLAPPIIPTQRNKVTRGKNPMGSKKPGPNLIVVGDDDQSIYRFRSAAVSNILDFKKDYPDAETVVLTENYRSTQSILDSAYLMIQNNNPDRLEVKTGVNKKLKSKRDKKTAIETPPRLIIGETSEEESDRVVKKILELSKERGFLYKDFAILARANNHLDPFVVSLKRNGIPYSLVGNRGLFDQAEIRSLMAFLKVLVNKNDNVSLYQLLTTPAFSLESNEVTQILTTAKLKKESLWETIENLADNSTEEFAKKCKEIVNQIEGSLKKITNRHVVSILYDFVVETGTINKLLKEETIESALKIKNINLFFDKVKKFEAETENPTVFEFVDYLEMLIDAGENPAQAEIEDIDTVKLLTAHSAKGLEFPVVFVVNMVSDRFPTRERGEPLSLPDDLIKEPLPEGDAHLEEERRLFYVAVTRAKDLLHVTYAKNYGGVREKKMSGFVKELNPEEERNEEESQLSLLNFNLSGGKEKKPTKIHLPEETNTPKYVSYSQLETFETCPLKYYYRYILGLTGTPSHALTFGQTIHRTLRDFHQAEMFGKEYSLDNLLKIYQDHWIGEGYEDIEHRKLRFKEGLEILKQYYERYKNLLNKPVFLEKKFTVKTGNLFLTGSIDRIDQNEMGEYELIDYKTGEGKRKKQEIDKDEQLTIYALAAKEVLKINPKSLSLYFIEQNEKVTTERSDEDLEKIKQKMIEVFSQIGQSTFPAKVGLWCNFCEFNRICPAYKIGKN